MLDVPALQAFERFLIGLETKSSRHDHSHIAFDAAAMAFRVDIECSLGAGHVQVVNVLTTNQYPDSYGRLAAMQIRATRLT
jgi:hypothetical protein